MAGSIAAGRKASDHLLACVRKCGEYDTDPCRKTAGKSREYRRRTQRPNVRRCSPRGPSHLSQTSQPNASIASMVRTITLATADLL